MKYNGKSNVITDVDITLTDPKHIGESLQTVLEDTDNRIDKLESNVKWIYQNGGVGSGSGGGGGTTKWYIRATLNGISLDSNQQVPLSNGAGNYQLRLYTNGGSGNYNVTYTCGSNPARKVVLNADNGWSALVTVSLTENGILEIIATDGSITREITGVSYIVIPYVFNAPKLYKLNPDGIEYESEDVFVETAKNSGMSIRSSYVIATEGQFWYTWYFNGIAQSEPVEIIEKSGVLAYNVPSTLFENENAGLYTYQLVVSVLATGSTEPYDIVQSGSFNLIPDSLYLKISTADSNDVIYDSSSILDPYTFSTNTSVALNTRIYNGLTSSGKRGEISWIVNGDPSYAGNGSLSVIDGITYAISTYFTSAGWNYVTFNYVLDGVAGTPVTKYFYCEEVSTSYDWFFVAQNGSNNLPSTRRYYIGQNPEGDKIYGITGVGASEIKIEKLKSDSTVTTLGVTKTVNGQSYISGDQMFNFGIQYNEINDTSLPIIICYDTSNNEAIKIYQNKVVFGGQFSATDEISCNLFIHKETLYEPEDRTKYHLLTINCATCYYADNKSYYELSVYLDGKLEGVVQTKPFSSAEISRIALQNVNFALNHFELSSWGAIQSRRVFDCDINWYYNSYVSRLGKSISDEDTLILTSLFDTTDLIAKPDYSIENQLLKVNAGLPYTIAKNSTIPVLALTCSRDIIYNEEPRTIYEWMNSSWRDGEINLNKSTFNVLKVEWSPGGENSVLSEIDQPKDGAGNLLGNFTLDLQGSSTMTYKSKNFTLGIRPTEFVTAQSKVTLFSPNFDSNKESTFLPETAFTLKADVVDSSHSNNTAVGKFVNENNDWGYRSMINFTGVDSKISSHVKQCLEGFSILVFLNVTWREQDIDYSSCYYLGIYNFNLGRDSYFNLGYTDLSQLDPDTLDASALSNHGFAFCIADRTPVPGFVATEIQDNSRFWDFSQYDDTILFPLEGLDETSGFMFGDFVYGPQTEGVQRSIKSFVKSVAAAGGYLFDQIGKRWVPCNTVVDNTPQAYHKYDTEIDPETGRTKVYTYVSDYRTQYRRSRVGQDQNYDPYPGELQTLNIGHLQDCIIGDISQGKNPSLDYRSIVYYYVTCMVLGLVDSVQKNLNIKTWNASNADNAYPKMGAFFYDMDTCLGKTNSGDKTSYFAFSDYWKSNVERYDASGNLIPEDDTTTVAVRTVNKGITNFRDTFLPGSKVTGYDTPSSYLFAIAKYAYLFQSVRENFENEFPQNIYAKWRQANGVLSSADNFIDKYFASNLNKIPESLINLNYRNKYLYDYEVHDNFSNAVTMLHGTGVEEVRDWLKGRLRIMDAYFNVIGATIQINGNYSEPIPTYNVTTNPDINLRKDVFTNETTTYVSRKSSLNFNITAPDYSPLVVRYGNDYLWYIFEDSNVEYETQVIISGVLITVFGGSQMWRTLDSINSFVESRDSTSSTFIFNTDILRSMVGTSGTQTGTWDVYGPSLERISLTSSNYGGSLSVNNKFYSLSNIDISNSRISLNATNHCPVKNIIATNLKNALNFTVTDCDQLENVSLNNSVIGTCTITPTWTDNLNFSSVYATTLTLAAKNSGTLTINNNASVNSLSFKQMENISINNCSSLTSVLCTDTTDAILRNVTITNCPALTSLTLKADNLEVLNLYGCTALEEITLTGSSFNNLRILGLGNTKVSKMTIGQTVCTGGVFDFRQFTKLAKADPNYSGTPYVSFYNNKHVVSIQFDNTGDTILYSDPNRGGLHDSNGAFRSCSNLERIYGSFLIECPYCFYDSQKFSVHGADLRNVSWYGQNVLDSSGRCKHPSEWGVATSYAYWPRTTGITNMRFNGNYANGVFYLTNHTIFDVYYMLYGCTSSVKSLYETFRQSRNSSYGHFDWNTTVDNSPNIKTFTNCGSVENISLLFYGNSGTIRFFSPSHSGETVTANNGLFSPLVALKNDYWSFVNYTTYVDRFVLRRASDSDSYLIEQLDGFRCNRILDDVNSYQFNTIPSYNISDYGKLTGFFKNLTELAGEVKGLFSDTAIINFSTISNIPDGVTALRSCFVSTYGTGTISLTNYFSENTNLQRIYQSFITKNEFAGNYPMMTLSNTTFARFVPRTGYTGLLEIGYSNTNSNYPVSGPLGSSFSGVIYKSFGSSFPFDIFKNLTNLTMASGVFMNAHGTVTDLALPGRLFEKNTRLVDCSAEFYDIDNDYTISDTYGISYDTSGSTPVAVISKTSGSPNFVYCPNIANVSYLFGSTQGDTIPHLSGQIHRNLFWHGLNTSNTKRNTITGTNTRTPIEDPETGDTIGYNYGEPTSVYQYVIVPNKTISNISNCFQHCNCDAYLESSLPYEPNPNYSPFTYLTDNGTDFYDNPNKDEAQYTAEWFYDGFTNYTTIADNTNCATLPDFVNWDAVFNVSDKKYVSKTSDWLEVNVEDGYEDVKPQVRDRYICAPDLLRYCTPNTALSNLFAYSGVIGMNTRWHVSSNLWSNGGKYAFGILGRICPYLLKPVQNTTDVSGMFLACKRISSVSDEQSNTAYMLPAEFLTYTKNISKLQNMFKATVQPKNVYLAECFTSLTRNNLDIQYIFANCYWQGTNESPAFIQNVFRNNNIDSLVGAFEMEGESTQNAYPKAQYVTFSNVFNSRYATSTYASDMKFAHAFYGWLAGYVTHESTKTLPDNTTTNNYTYATN